MADKIVLYEVKRGVLKSNVKDEVIAEAERSEIASAEVGGGTVACPLTISFTNGATWEYEVPRAAKKAAERVAGVLGT